MTGPLSRASTAARAAITAHLEWIFRLASLRPRTVTLISLLLLLLSLASVLSVRFETDVFKLFPSGRGPLRLMLDAITWTGGANDAYFVLEGDRERLLREGETFAARLKALRLDGAPAFSKVVYRSYDPNEAAAFADFVAFAAAHPQLFLTPARVPELAERLTPAGMDRALSRARTELASQAGMALRGLIAADPLSLRDFFLPRLQRAGRTLDLDPDAPYLISRDGRLLIIVARTARPVQDLAFARQLVAAIDRARRGFSVQISCTGAHLAAVIDERTMKSNILACIVSSLAVVLALFYLTYRRLLPTLLIPLILLFGVAFALGTAGLFLSSIHIISFAFMSLIIGLGTDYSIHVYDRFYSERAAGVGLETALRRAFIDTGQGIFTAALTTALPFLALMVSEVRALFELGLLVGLGVIFSMYATLFFLPPILLFGERRYPGAAYRPLPGFGLKGAWRLSRRRPRVTVTVSLAAVAGLLAAASSIGFESDLKKLQPKRSEALVTQERIERHLSMAPGQMLVALEGDRVEPLLERGEQLEGVLEKYRRQGEIADYSSLGQALNAESEQRRLLPLVAERLSAGDPAAALRVALKRNGFALAPFLPAVAGLDAFSRAAPVPADAAVARLSSSPLGGIVERHLLAGDGDLHLLAYLYYRPGKLDQFRLLKELQTVDPAVRATSQELVGRQLEDSVRRSFTWGFALGGLLVLLLLFAHFSSLAGILLTLYPVLSGVVAMLGLMALFGTGLNFMNAMVLVTILGMGSDYGLHLLHRVTAQDEAKRCGQYVQAGRAVLLSALTTIAGFGSLAFSDYGALASIGTATNYGVAATAILALFSLPAFMGKKCNDIE